MGQVAHETDSQYLHDKEIQYLHEHIEGLEGLIDSLLAESPNRPALASSVCLAFLRVITKRRI